MLEVLTRQIATPSSPPTTHRSFLCVLIGQKRTCEVGAIIFSMDKELTSSRYFLERVCYSYILFI